MPIPRSVLRMTDEELNELLTTERTCRVATVSPDGDPHVVPLWFVWLDGAMYFNNLKRSRRTRDIERGSRVSVCVDAGHDYGELRGAVLYGTMQDASDDPGVADVRQAFGDKYAGGIVIPQSRSHAWLKLVPERTKSWDFKKIPSGRDRRLQESRGS